MAGTGAMPVEELDEAFITDPHTVYRRLRQQAPVARAVMPRGLQVWLVTRYEQARAALADPRLSKDTAGAQELFARHAPESSGSPAFAESLAAHMLNSDPPDHTRLRTLVNKAFTSRVVESLRPRIEQISDELLDTMAAADEVDLIEAFAFPLPITVICELLGVPRAEREDFRRWSNAIVSAAATEEVASAATEMATYLSGLIATKRQSPGEDLLSGLVRAHDEGDRLSDNELLSMAFLLLVAGHETTVNLIGNGTLALLREPDQLAALRARPALLPSAIEEFLRYQGPVNLATLRYTTDPVVFGGVEIPKGEFVLVSLASANRDPDRFAAPDTLDVQRSASGHLGFGHGIHYCVGAPLARLEAEVAFSGLLQRFPRLRLAAEPHTLQWRHSTLMRGLTSLPVRLR